MFCRSKKYYAKGNGAVEAIVKQLKSSCNMLPNLNLTLMAFKTVIDDVLQAGLARVVSGDLENSPVVWAAISAIYQFAEMQEKVTKILTYNW